MNNTPTDFAGLMSFGIGIFNSLVYIIFALAFVVLIWKLIDAWIINADNESKRGEGKVVAVIAVVVMVIMASIWGILAMLQSSIL